MGTYALRLYIYFLTVLSIFLTTNYLLFYHVPINFIHVLPFFLLAVFAEFNKVTIVMNESDETVSISWTLVITIAALLSFGVLAALVINITSATITSLYPKKLNPLKLLYNISSHAITVLFTGALFYLFETVLFTTTNEQMINMLLYCFIAIFYVLVNYSLGTILMKLVTKLPIKSVITDIIFPHLPYSLMLSFIGALLGVSYAINEIISLSLSLFFIWLLLFSLKSSAKAASERIKELTRSKEQSDQLAKQLDKTFDEFIETLTATMDARDKYMFGHSTQVAHYAVAIAEELNLPKKSIEKIRIAGLLHDIGKIFIPEEILFKAGPLTDEEYEVIKEHPAIGEEIISQVSSLQDVAELIGMHHERFDGKGYPKGLAADDVPLEAYIIGASDALEAMVSDRSYHRGRKVSEAMKEFQRCKGTQFHPLVIDTLFKIRKEKGDNAFKNSAVLVEKSIIVSKLKTNNKINLKPLKIIKK
jgi:putative nucleotidyltransferase with HDIG domain